MPITDTLKNAESFRRVGFTEEQASLPAESLEETAHAQSADLKSFIRSELGSFRQEMAAMEGRLEGKIDNLEARTDAKIEGLRAGMHEIRGELKADNQGFRADVQAALRDQLLKIVISTVAIVSLAVAIIKAFPNAG